MKVNKFNNENEFIINRIKEELEKINESSGSEEKKNYDFKHIVDIIMNDKNSIGTFYTANNIINKSEIESIFDKFNKSMKIINTKSDEIEHYIERLNNVNKNAVSPLLTKVNNLLNRMKNLNNSDCDYIEDYKNSNITEHEAISTTNGFLELRAKEDKETHQIGGVEVISSNGLPGDTHTAYMDGGNIIFNGETNSKLNINNIINDNCYEYELINISKEDYKKAKGYGFKYDEDIPYVSKDKILNLKLKLYLKKEKEINSITFNDYQISSPYIIKSITILNSNNNTPTIVRNTMSNNFNSFSFATQSVKEITLNLEQTSKDKCYIGHFYNSNIKQSDYGYYEEYEDIRIGSITNLCVTVDANSKIIKHPSTNNSSETFSENATRKALYTNNLNRQLIPCERFSISLGNFKIHSNSYENKGFCITQYTTQNPIKSISLDADEYIPNTNDETYIRYSISFNKETWYSIVPAYRASSSDIHTISINSAITTTPLNMKSIFTNNKETAFYLKTELGTSDSSVTPRIEQVKFKVKVSE